LNVEDWAEIRRLYRAEGMPIKVIARRLGIARNTVRRAIGAAQLPRYERAGKGSIVDAVEPQIRELLKDWPTMPATVIAERIGWTRSLTVLKERVRLLRPLFMPPDPAQRTEYDAGQIMQCDLWFPPVQIPLGFGQTDSPPVLVMVAGYSRWLSAVMIPSRQIPDLLLGHWALISALGVAPRMLVWDNESGIGQWRGGKPQLTTAMNAFRGTLGITIRQCRPNDPESKGLVERANGYLETSFLPGRSFTSPADFNLQLRAWLPVANNRQHRVLGCRRRTVSKRTGRRWWRCHRSRRRSDGGCRPGCPAITTCVWTPTTTRCIRRLSAAGSRSRRTWPTSRWSVTDGRSPGMTAAGPGINRSPTRPTGLRPTSFATRIVGSR
jgi:transposase